MKREWKTVRVFISSTFRDMHAERDHLVRVVFPELKERCRRIFVQLIDVDLRWGVTEEEARGGKALQICLEEIDQCRPHFIALLGHRYGWVPQGQSESITASEILHGVFHGYLPQQLASLESIQRPEICGTTLSAEENECLQRCYPYDSTADRHLLATDVTPGEAGMLRDVFKRITAYQQNRSYFFFRSKRLSRKLARSQHSLDFFEEDVEKQEKLEELKQKVVEADLKPRSYDSLEELGRQVLELVWNNIESELGEPEEVSPTLPGRLEREEGFHEAFRKQRSRYFTGRTRELTRLMEFSRTDSPEGILLAHGGPGSGKSALLAQFVARLRGDEPDFLVLSHFVGASSESTGLREALRRFCEILSQETRGEEPVPATLRDLLELFPLLLERGAKSRQIVIVLDAANQFDPWDNASTMHWIPQPVVPGVRWVISTLSGDASSPDPVRGSLQRRRPPAAEMEIGNLDPGETREFVHTYLTDIRRHFPTAQVEAAFLERLEGKTPLYTWAALEELRVFGDFDRLDERVGELPESIEALFDQVLERIEQDFRQFPGLVGDFLSILTCLRRPMPEEFFVTVLAGHARGEKAGRLPELFWARLRRAMRFYLLQRGEFVDYFHGQFRSAAERRYLSGTEEKQRTHGLIADYFVHWETLQSAARPEIGAYALRFACNHLIEAGRWKTLRRLLHDPDFLEACRKAGQSPAASLAEGLQALQGKGPDELAGPVRNLVTSLLRSHSFATRQVMLNASARLEWLDLLLHAARSRDSQTRMEASVGFFSVYLQGIERGEEEAAWKGVEMLQGELKGALGVPRRSVASSLMGLFVSIFIECGERPEQIERLGREAIRSAWSVIPLGRPTTPAGREFRRRAFKALVRVIRPGIDLALSALDSAETVINAKTARPYFRRTQEEKDVYRAYFPFLEPVHRDLGPFVALVDRYGTVNDPFHYDFIFGGICGQCLVQPEEVLSLCRRMAAKDDSLALYKATRGLIYLLWEHRDSGHPREDLEPLLLEWLVAYYRRPDYRLEFTSEPRLPGEVPKAQTTLEGGSLVEEVGTYLAVFHLRGGKVFDELMEEAMSKGSPGLLRDLCLSLGRVGVHGGSTFALSRLGPVVQNRPALQDSETRKIVVEALARINCLHAQEVAEWIDNLSGAAITLEEITGNPLAAAGVWQSSTNRLLRRVLVHEYECRCILFAILNGLPRSRSLTGFLFHVLDTFIDILVDEKIPENPYAETHHEEKHDKGD